MASSNKKLTENQQRQILALVEDGHSFRETARILGFSDATVRKYCAESDIDLTAVAQPDTLLKLGRQVSRQQQTIRVYREQVKKVNERGYGFDDFVAALKDVAAEERKNAFKYHPSKFSTVKNRGAQPSVDADHQEVACLALSDWHIAETVRLRDSNDINVYNSVIGANRLWHIVQRFKQIFSIHRAAFKFKSIWLPLLGDMVSGSIHPEFISTNDLSDQNSVVLAARLLKYAILELKQLDVPIQIDTVVGNHPRTTFKVPTKRIADTNFDYQLYAFTAMLFEGDDQVKFNIHTSQLAPVEVFGHRYVIEHGIEWKNGKEEESEDRIRALFDDPVYREATGHTGSAFDQIVIGNLHKGAFLERTIKNPSLIGQNELGQQWRLKPIRAGQNAWGVSSKRVRTFQYELDATTIRSSKPVDNNPFAEFAYNFVRDHGVRYEY